MAWKHNDRIIRVGKSWVSDDNWKHPYNWSSSWTEQNKIDFSVVWEDEPDIIFDDRFYSSKDVEKSLADTLWVDKDGKAIIDPITGKQGVYAGLKSKYITETKLTTNQKLSTTDWYVTRKAEASTAIPSAISTYRTDVRTASKTIEDKINAVNTLAKFMALFEVPIKDGEPHGNPPIYDFPKEV